MHKQITDMFLYFFLNFYIHYYLHLHWKKKILFRISEPGIVLCQHEGKIWGTFSPQDCHVKLTHFVWLNVFSMLYMYWFFFKGNEDKKKLISLKLHF